MHGHESYGMRGDGYLVIRDKLARAGENTTMTEGGREVTTSGSGWSRFALDGRRSGMGDNC